MCVFMSVEKCLSTLWLCWCSMFSKCPSHLRPLISQGDYEVMRTFMGFATYLMNILVYIYTSIYFGIMMWKCEIGCSQEWETGRIISWGPSLSQESRPSLWFFLWQSCHPYPPMHLTTNLATNWVIYTNCEVYWVLQCSLLNCFASRIVQKGWAITALTCK